MISKTKIFIAVLLMAAGLILLPARSAYAAGDSIYLTPAAANVGLNSEIDIAVRMNSGSPINAAQITMSYPAELLDYISTSFDGSAFDIQASSSGGSGSVKMVLGATSPVNGDQLLATISFKSKSAAGSANISILSDSMLVSGGHEVSTTKTGSVLTIGSGASQSTPKSKSKTSPSPAAPTPTPIETGSTQTSTAKTLSTSASSKSEVTINLRVKDVKGAAVSGATIKAGDTSYTTDGSGKTKVTVPIGKSTIEISKGPLKTTTVIAPGPEAADNKDYTISVVLAASKRGVNWLILAPFIITAAFIVTILVAKRVPGSRTLALRLFQKKPR